MMPTYNSRISITIAILLIAAAAMVQALAPPALYMPLGLFTTPGNQKLEFLGTLFSHHTHKYVYLVMTVYFCCACLIGYLGVLQPFFRRSDRVESDGNAAFGLLAGFIPGYLIIIPVNRLVTLGVGNASAPWVCLTIIAFFTTMLFLLRRRQFGRGSTSIFAQTLKVNAKNIFACLLLIFLMLIFTLQYSGAHITGDATIFTFKNVLLNHSIGPGSDSKFPMFAEHYDEVTFLYPILYGFFKGDNADFIVPYWWLGAFAKSSAFVLLVVSLARIGTSKRISLLIASAIFFGATFINPLNDMLLFDSGNPVLHIMHPGRVISSILPFVLWAWMLSLDSEMLARFKTWELSVIAIGSAGLASLSLHVVLILFLVVFTYLASRIAAYNVGMTTHRQITELCVGAVVISAPIILFEKRYPTTIVNTAWAFVVIIVAFFPFIVGMYSSRRLIASRIRVAFQAKSTRAITMAGIGYVLGAVFLGNTLHAALFPGGSLSRGLLPSSFRLGLDPSPPAHMVLNGGASAQAFMIYYGLPVLLSGVALVALPLLPLNLRSRLTSFLYASVPLFFIGIMMFFFTNGSENNWLSIWVKSRLLESWYYMLIGSSLMVILSASGGLGTIGIAAVLCWTLIPFILWFDHSVVAQLVANLNWWISRGMSVGS